MAMPRNILLSFLVLFITAGNSFAAEYSVCVNPDPTTESDLSIIQGFLTNGLDEEASPTLRRITMGAVGEMGALLNNSLVGNRLTLGDGSEISLVEGDTINIGMCKEGIQNDHVSISFRAVDHTPPGQICCNYHCQPVLICHFDEFKVSCISLPPKKKF